MRLPGNQWYCSKSWIFFKKKVLYVDTLISNSIFYLWSFIRTIDRSLLYITGKNIPHKIKSLLNNCYDKQDHRNVHKYSFWLYQKNCIFFNIKMRLLRHLHIFSVIDCFPCTPRCAALVFRLPCILSKKKVTGFR